MQKPIISFVFIIMLCHAQLSHATTNISGQIRTNTTWTKAGSPYILSGVVEVAPDILLTIEPGTIIKGDSRLNIYGKISAVGTKTDSIYFYSNVLPKYWYCVDFLSHNPEDTFRFEYCSFNMGGLVYSDEINISVRHSTFNWVGFGSQGYGKGYVNISDCKFVNAGIRVKSCEYADIYNNEIKAGSCHFENMKEVTVIGNNISGAPNGIFCSVEHPIIQNNVIFNTSQIGLDIRKGQLDPDKPLSGNILTQNKGIAMNIQPYNNVIYATGLIAGNSIYDNHVGVAHHYPDDTKTVTFKNNCIYNNTQANFHNYSGGVYRMPDNWWGTTDSAQIEKMVIDHKDDFKLGTVLFAPVLNQIHSSCNQYSVSVPHQEDIQNELVIYPNPFNNVFNIQVDNNSKIDNVSIFDITGKLCESVLSVNKEQVSIDTRLYQPGFYIYKVILSDGTIATGKITKQ